MFFETYFFIITVSAFLFATMGTGFIAFVLRQTDVMDEPNERSNHDIPTPRGGGIAVLSSIIAFLIVSGVSSPIIYALLALGIISFLDDIRGVSILWRFAIQIATVAWLIHDSNLLVFQGLLPQELDNIATGIIWLWFINAYNFMDGIDGITGSQTVGICLGLAVCSQLITDFPNGLLFDLGIVGAAVFGFLLWNWHPAKIFIGDVGSITLGFIVGLMLLKLANLGYWPAALLLPAYYVIDASLTLFKQVITGKKFWQAHSEHAYQQAARAGKTHSQIVKRINLLHILLIILAAVSVVMPELSIALLAIGYALSLVIYLSLKRAKGTSHAMAQS
jgi:UDP-N-acetylmuramyl pentapeptide phosphotransferase/UDP-N-acetylglucosamine-1-phosphate transferase